MLSGIFHFTSLFCRDSSVRTLRHTLTSVLLRLLGTRIFYEDADVSFYPVQKFGKREVELPVEASSGTALDGFGESLFDMFLSIFHGLLSGCKPCWLKLSSPIKPAAKTSRDLSGVDRDFAETLQAELDRMHLPFTIRKRIQSAMPMLPPSPPLSISCQPPVLPASLYSGSLVPGLQPVTPSHNQRSLTSNRLSTGAKSKSLHSHDPETEIDPWTLLEDGTGSLSTPGSNTDISGLSNDHANLKACSWLKGAVRIRRTDLTYVGAVDEDN